MTDDSIVSSAYFSWATDASGPIDVKAFHEVQFGPTIVPGVSAGLGFGTNMTGQDVVVSPPTDYGPWGAPAVNSGQSSFNASFSYTVQPSNSAASLQFQQTSNFAAGSSVGSYILHGTQKPIQLDTLSFPSAACEAETKNAIHIGMFRNGLYRAGARPYGHFSPVGGLLKAAAKCGFSGFNWQQTLYVDPPGYGPSKATPFCDGAACPVYYSANLPVSNALSLAYNERSSLSECPNGNYSLEGTGDKKYVLCYTDLPTIGLGIQLGYFEEFKTSLVGVLADGSISSPLAEWIWIDAYDKAFAISNGCNGAIECYAGHILIVGATDNVVIE